VAGEGILIRFSLCFIDRTYTCFFMNGKKLLDSIFFCWEKNRRKNFGLVRKMSGGWERLRGSRSRTTRDSSFHTPAPSRTVTLGRVQPQAPGHRTIYCNDRDANLPVRFKVCVVSFLFSSVPFNLIN
jgi:hypothetical protein